MDINQHFNMAVLEVWSKTNFVASYIYNHKQRS